ncbi:MAG: type II secretion system protein GspF [Sorangiineae bacterium NIC37A_2]|jgi:general secretion pathway protein F|nr:MAG: type II secretion system protein GspF [Sorangiineae bacterium NIC37A_2]
MAVFEYQGIDAATGKQVKGVRDAENPRALRNILRRDGILLTQARAGKEAQAGAKRDIDLLAVFKQPRSSDVAVMTRQLATLVRAGIPLVESISALTEQVEKQALVHVLSSVRDNLRTGTAFAKCLSEHPKVFPPLYVNMVAAGEASGTLEAVLERLADFMEGQSRLKGKVMGALAYPVALGGVGVLLVGFLMVSVVPRLTTIFDNLGQALPWYTQLLIFLSNTVSGYWWLIILVMGGISYAFMRWKKTPKGHLRWDIMRLSFPLFGRLNLLVALARFTRTLATLLSSGVQLLPAMEIGKNVLENVKLEQVIKEAIGSIREGESIAEPLKRSGAFPPMVTHMIAVGERSGELEAMLENVSRAYEADVETRIGALTSVLEPMMILLMGGAVGFIVFAIMMPLLQMNDMVQ